MAPGLTLICVPIVISLPMIGAGFHRESLDSIFLVFGSKGSGWCCYGGSEFLAILSNSLSASACWYSFWRLTLSRSVSPWPGPSFASERLNDTSERSGRDWVAIPPPIIMALSTCLASSYSIFAYALLYSAGSRIFIAWKFNSHTLLMKTFFKFSCIMCLFRFWTTWLLSASLSFCLRVSISFWYWALIDCSSYLTAVSNFSLSLFTLEAINVLFHA